MQKLIKKILFNYIKEQPTDSSPADNPESNDQPDVATDTEVETETPPSEPKSAYTYGGGSSGGGSAAAKPKSDNSDGKAKQTWSSGVARSVGNQVANTVWKPSINRSKANPLGTEPPWESGASRGKANPIF